MLNLRYHIVSLVAVFLALGIGVAVGSAIVDRAIVGALEDRVDAVEAVLGDVEAERDRLAGRVGELEALEEELGDQAGALLLEERLDGVPVLVLAARGVAEDPVSALRDHLDDAGARDDGTIWFTDALLLEEPAQREALAEALEVTPAEAGALRTTLAGRLGRALLSSDPDEAAELLEALRDSGFVEIQGGASTDDAPRTPLRRLVVVSGEDAVLPAEELLLPLLRALPQRRGAIPAVAAEVAATAVEGAEETEEASGTEQAPGLVAAVRDDGRLQELVATVDDLDGVAGWLATALALEDLGDGQVGHYGRADGASRLLPPPDR